MHKILIINGPNLNILGRREPKIYGYNTLNKIITSIKITAKILEIDIESFQSNSENQIINCIHNTIHHSYFIIFNPGAFTHTSIAIRDALISANAKFVECHISNIYTRETFRQHSYFADLAIGIITGFGNDSYQLALYASIKKLSQKK